MPEPTGDERHPFADIIDLFREDESGSTPAPAEGPEDASPVAGPTTHAEAAAAVLAAADFTDAPKTDAPKREAPKAEAPKATMPPAPTPAPSAPADRGGTPVVRTPKAPTPPPTTRRRAVMLLPVALLAIAGGATAAVIHHQHSASKPTATATSTAAPSAAPTTSAPSPSAAAPASDPATAAYSAALDAYAAAQSGHDLAAAKPAAATIQQIRTAGGPLARAEAKHLASLAALSTLADQGAPSDFPARVTTATQAAGKVGKAAHDRDDVPDSSVATKNVVTVVGTSVVGRLDTQVARLAGSAGAATLTAQLRSVAASAQALTPTATSTAAALDGDPADRARADAAALKALAALSVIDGDHLDSWAPLSAPLQQALAAAGVSSGAKDVAAINAMIGTAQQTMQAWAAGNDLATAGATSPEAATKAAQKAAQKAAKAQKAALKSEIAAITSYQTSASALIDRYSQTIAGLPVVGPGQAPSFPLANQFFKSVKDFGSLSTAVSRLHAPAGMSGAQQALVNLVAKGRSAAIAGQSVAVAAEDCDASKRSCEFGTQSRWPTYSSSVNTLGNPSTVRATLTKAASTAKAKAAADAAKTPAATAPVPAESSAKTPPKPVV